jgi:hypothetical protein
VFGHDHDRHEPRHYVGRDTSERVCPVAQPPVSHHTAPAVIGSIFNRFKQDPRDHILRVL